MVMNQKKYEFKNVKRKQQYIENALFLAAVGSERFRAPYESACQLLVERLNQINQEVSTKIGRRFIKDISGRVKSAQSCLDKMIEKKCKINLQTAREQLNDIAGVRVVCFFLDDIYRLADLLLRYPEYKIIKRKDYVKKPKSSGYQSLHLIFWVPVELAKNKNIEEQGVKVEIQLRTQAMDFWSNIEHHLIYKVTDRDLSEFEEEFFKCSKSIQRIDRQMLKIRKKIQADGRYT